jgi:hypothetical protein
MKHGLTAFALAAALVAAGAALADDTPPTAPPTAPADETATTASDDGMAGNVQFLIGQTYLGDFWAPLDEPAAFGVEVDFGPKKSPVHVAIATNVSGDNASVESPFLGQTGHVAVGFIEFSAGFVWLPVRHAVARPYLGAGALTLIAGVDAGANAWNGGDSDQSFGFYGNAGIYFKVGNTFNIGFDGRLVRGTSITLAGQETDADYERVSLLLGFSWGE